MIEDNETIGILLAGGKGTRLWPTTAAVSKQLLPVAGRPMITFPLATLMLAGIRKIKVVCSPQSIDGIRTLLGTGELFGVDIEYVLQREPTGIPSGFALAAGSHESPPALAILGDNFFYGPKLGGSLQSLTQFPKTTTVFLKRVPDVRPFGAANIGKDGSLVSVSEKPKNPETDFAITGLYLFKRGDLDLVSKLKPSNRGETEIVDLLGEINRRHIVSSQVLSRSTFWSDLGTYQSISAVENYVKSIEDTQLNHVLVPELVAVENRLVGANQMISEVGNYPNSSYRDYLLAWLENNEAEV